jgi:adenylate kinase family enzyme
LNMRSFPYQRVIVVGATGSGKSTLAEKLSQKLGLDFIEMDALHWLPGWQSAADEDFLAKVDEATCGQRWVIAGNYSKARDVTWPRAEVVIWLDYSLWTVFWRLWRRTWRRWWTRELLWGTNRERLLSHFKIWSTEDSLFRWLFSSYWRRKREYPRLFAQAEYAHLQIIHFHSPAETDGWLASLE